MKPHPALLAQVALLTRGIRVSVQECRRIVRGWSLFADKQSILDHIARRVNSYMREARA